jgi:hypothetical protein
MDEVHGQLKSDGSHIGALQGCREVEMEVQQFVHSSIFFDLSTFHVTKKFQEPLERFLSKKNNEKSILNFMPILLEDLKACFE